MLFRCVTASGSAEPGWSTTRWPAFKKPSAMILTMSALFLPSSLEESTATRSAASNTKLPVANIWSVAANSFLYSGSGSACKIQATSQMKDYLPQGVLVHGCAAVEQ